MAFIGDMFDSSKGSGFKAVGPTGQQLDQSYQNTQQAIGQQTNFANALNAANGIGNQSQVFNQLQGIANGTGPNPAQAALNQATGANVANQASLMAGQRGASANPGMIARQAAQQGANIQQQAAGQGATMQAQQQLNAINQAGGIAGQQVGAQGQALQTLNQAALTGQQNILGAQNNANTANAGIAAGNQQSQAGGIGGALSQLGPAAMLLAARGGEVPDMQHLASGGMANPFLAGWGVQLTPNDPATVGNQGNGAAVKAGVASGIGGLINVVGNQGAAPKVGKPIAGTESTPESGMGQAPMAPGKMPQAQMMTAAKGGKVETGSALKSGGKVPGQAQVSGDSLKNDNVHAMLSPGEIVVPRTITQGPDAPKRAAEFVAAILAKNGLGSKKAK